MTKQQVNGVGVHLPHVDASVVTSLGGDHAALGIRRTRVRLPATAAYLVADLLEERGQTAEATLT